MSNIIIIDDDYALECLEDNLIFRGHDACRLSSASEALRDIAYILSADLVILDVIMECPENLEGTHVSSGRTTGMVIYRKIREYNPDLPILAFSATQEGDIIDIFREDPKSVFLSKWSVSNMKELIDSINNMLGLKPSRIKPTTFIVHGHNDKAKLELKDYLQNTLGLPKPIILHEQPNLGRTLIEKFEDYAFGSNLAFILMTPDDIGASHSDSDDVKRRARQNVIFELGFFLGFLGRKTGRVFLLHSAPLELPSDLSGVIYIDISKGIESVGEQIRRELKYVITEE